MRKMTTAIPLMTKRAIELDTNEAEGYLALAWVQINRDWNWEGAELSLNKAAELEPGSASVLRYRSFLAHSLGRLKEAIAFHEQAIVLDPLLASLTRISPSCSILRVNTRRPKPRLARLAAKPTENLRSFHSRGDSPRTSGLAGLRGKRIPIAV